MKTHRSLLAFLIVVGLAMQVAAQTETSTTLSLRALDAKTGDAISQGSQSMSIRIDGTAGLWVHPMILVYLDPLAAGNSNVDAWLETYPWLARVELSVEDLAGVGYEYAIGSGPGTADGPLYQSARSAPGTPTPVENLLSRAAPINFNTTGVPSLLDGNLVRYYFQHIDGDAGTNDASLNWQTTAQDWDNTLQQRDWRKKLVWRPSAEPSDSNYVPIGQEFDVMKCVEYALRKQAPNRASADALYDSGVLVEMMNSGYLMISVQPIGLVDELALSGAATDPPTGLDEYPDPPKVKTKTPTGTPIFVRTGGVRGHAVSASPILPVRTLIANNATGYLVVPAEVMLPPFAVDLSIFGQIYTLQGEIAPKLGHVRFPLPSGLLDGDIVRLIGIKDSEPTFTLTPITGNFDLTVL